MNRSAVIAFVVGFTLGGATMHLLGPRTTTVARVQDPLQAHATEGSFGEIAVRRSMFDPDAAKFRNMQHGPRDPLIWCGEVNGKNRFGAMVGFRRFVVLADPRFPQNVDEASVFVEQDDEDRRSFDGRWGIYCLK